MSFKAFETDDFVVSADSITAGLWTGNAPELTAFFTSSTQVASSNGAYYINVYNSESYEDIQFAIAYGDVDGSGSLEFDSSVPGKSPSSTNYGQYRTLVLGDETAEFSFGGVTAPNFYVISVERNRYKEGLFPGSTTLKLDVGGNDLYLTDNSQVATTVEFNDAGRVFQLVSGSAGTVFDTTSTGGGVDGYSASGSYGLFLPDISTYILNPSALDAATTDGGIALSTVRGDDVDSENAGRLYDAIVTGASFTANSEETITSDFIFVRPRSSEFNYSENPSFISGSTGEVLYSSFINNPTTYITTVGLYNDSSELLAVAKLSTPLPKDFTKEALVRVKLDF